MAESIFVMDVGSHSVDVLGAMIFVALVLVWFAWLTGED